MLSAHLATHTSISELRMFHTVRDTENCAIDCMVSTDSVYTHPGAAFDPFSLHVDAYRVSNSDKLDEITGAVLLPNRSWDTNTSS